LTPQDTHLDKLSTDVKSYMPIHVHYCIDYRCWHSISCVSMFCAVEGCCHVGFLLLLWSCFCFGVVWGKSAMSMAMESKHLFRLLITDNYHTPSIYLTAHY